MNGRDESPRGATARSQLAQALRRAVMPFRAEAPLTAHDRRVVALCWGAAGMLFAGVWTAALALLMPGFSGARALAVALLLVLGGGLFFGAAGYALVGIGQRLIASQPARLQRPPPAHATHEGASADARHAPEP